MEKVRNKWLYVLLSVAIAIGLWYYVGKVVNPEKDATVRSVPVVFAGQDLLEDKGLMITSGLDQTVTLKIKGKLDAINRLDQDTVTVTVDVSKLDQPGDYTQAFKLTYNFSGAATSTSSLELVESHPSDISFTVANMKVTEVPVKGVFTGSVAEGYQAGEFSISPEKVEIRGEAAVIEQVDHAVVTLNEKGLSSSFSGDLPLTYVTAEGETLPPEKVQGSATLAAVTLPVDKLKEVPLTVEIVPGGGATADDLEYTLSQDSITVAGTEEQLAGLDAISLGKIDLSKITGSGTVSFNVTLDAGLTNVSGVTEVTVKYSLTGLTTATVEVSSIELINAPVGAAPVTQSRLVQIRGSKEAVAAVTPGQLRIVADLSGISAAAGNQTVPVKVYLDGADGVGVVGEYNIGVSVN